jgi:hypothetical protein
VTGATSARRTIGRVEGMSPAELGDEQRAELQKEIDDNRRSEYRLLPYGGIALLVIVAIAVVRVFFS